MRSNDLKFLLGFLLLVVVRLQAQNYVGQRQVINYQKQTYNAGTQNWKIRQDREGRMYFANNEGVLIFDGTYWQLYPLPNKTIVRSLEFGPDNNLYVGGQDEIGYFYNNREENLKFKSLKDLLSASDAKFSDIWEIVKFGSDLFFRSSTKIFRYRNGQMKVFNSLWLFLGISQGKLIAQDRNRGLMLYQNGDWVPYLKNPVLDNILITAITQIGSDSSLLFTVRDGIFLLSHETIHPFTLSGIKIESNQHYTNCIGLGNGSLLVSTYTNGFYQIDYTGKVTENFAKAEGLQNPNIRSMFLDKDHNVWLGLDNGIDFVAYNNAVKKINPPVFRDGGGFSVAKFNNQLYFGLSTGIFSLPLGSTLDLSFSKSDFSSLSNGQCWNLSIAANNLMAGKEDGVYQFSGSSFVPVNKSYGFWNFNQFNITGQPMFAAGNYNGVQLFSRQANGFIDKGNIPNFKESSRYLEVDSNNSIWVSHPYRGIYKIDPKSFQVKFYSTGQGLPSNLNNQIFKIGSNLVAATEKGIYEYKSNLDKFIPSEFYKSIFGDTGIRYLKEAPSHLLWFVQNKNVGVVDLSSEKKQITYLPELKGNILSGFENIYPIDDQNIFVGGEKGFYHVNYTNYKNNIHQLNVYIRKVSAFGKTDTTLFGGYFFNQNIQPGKGLNSGSPLNHNWNSLHFEFSSPLYEKESSVEYSCYLDEFDKDWSDWTNKTEKDYTNLPAGRYVFKVKARNHHNNDSTETFYSFEILPPWYQSTIARIMYILITLWLFYYLYKLQETKHYKKQQNELNSTRLKHDEEQRQSAYLHQLEMERSEKELIKIKNEKLESEIEHKNSQLASAAMNLVQKKEFLLKIKEELEHFNKPGKDSVEMSELKKILRSLSEEKKLNEEWEQFSIHFNTVQGDFLNIIQKKYPELKPHELKLCAYLRMNLSSKEMAQLMSISVRGVEISRYRLRKKLQIPTETNLFQFLCDLQRDEMKK